MTKIRIITVGGRRVESTTCGDCGRFESTYTDADGQERIETFTAFFDGNRYCESCRDRWPDRYSPPPLKSRDGESTV